jgi:hypothetical protein
MAPAFLTSTQARAGLALLLEAFDAAHDIPGSAWEFAVEIALLRDAGVSATLLRWLLRQDFCEHALELTLTGDEQRTFRALRSPRFLNRSCFILTDSGAHFARPLCQPDFVAELPMTPVGEIRGAPGTTNVIGTTNVLVKPHWNGTERELLLGNLVVTNFHGRPANQELVLTVFEEEGWPVCIDDPLPARSKTKAQSRLHDVVRALNQRQTAIHFSRDGSGERICWQFVPPKASTVT